MANSFTLSGYDAKIFWVDNNGVDYDTVPSGADLTDVYELSGVQTVSVSMPRERGNVKGTGQRTRSHKNIMKELGTLSIDCLANGSDTDSWGIVQTADDAPILAATTPGQCAIYIVVDANRDAGTDPAGETGTDLWIYTYSAFLNKVDISSAVNDWTKFKMDFLIGHWVDPTTTLPAEINTAASPSTGWKASTGTPVNWTSGAVATIDGGGGLDTTWSTAENPMDYVESYTLSINANLIPRYGWTNAWPRAIEKGALDITGSLVVDLNENYYQIQDIVDEEVDTLRFYVTATDYVTLTQANWDAVNLDWNEVALTMQNIPFTADSCAFTSP